VKRNRFAGVVLFALVASTALSCADDETPTPAATAAIATEAPDATGAPASADLATAAASAESCGYTPESTAGPYYVSGTRELTDGNLNYDDLDGTPLKVGGYVYASDENSEPVESAKIDIWQADDDGAYHPQDQGPASNFDPEDISLRGSVTTDERGYYEFSTILPGEYEGRTRHIHVRVDASGHQPLISQIIVAQEGDRFPPENDMIASSFPECSLVALTERDGMQTTLFNFHIR
jgi:protocatechuate 3,4-dioxygenase beta subunit